MPVGFSRLLNKNFAAMLRMDGVEFPIHPPTERVPAVRILRCGSGAQKMIEK